MKKYFYTNENIKIFKGDKIEIETAVMLEIAIVSDIETNDNETKLLVIDKNGIYVTLKDYTKYYNIKLISRDALHREE